MSGAGQVIPGQTRFYLPIINFFSNFKYLKQYLFSFPQIFETICIFSQAFKAADSTLAKMDPLAKSTFEERHIASKYCCFYVNTMFIFKCNALGTVLLIFSHPSQVPGGGLRVF